MRDPDRIEPLLDLIRTIWAKNSDHCWGSGDQNRTWPSWRKREAVAARELLNGAKEALDRNEKK